MIETLATAGLAGGGTGIGLIVISALREYMKARADAKREETRLNREAIQIAQQGYQNLHNSHLNVKAEEVELEGEQTTSRKLFLGKDKSYGYESSHKYKKEQMVWTPFTLAFASCFTIVIASFSMCIVWLTFLWSGSPSEIIYAFHPTAGSSPDEYELFLGLISWKSADKSIYELTTGGALLGIIHVAVYCLTTATTAQVGRMLK